MRWPASGYASSEISESVVLLDRRTRSRVRPQPASAPWVSVAGTSSSLTLSWAAPASEVGEGSDNLTSKVQFGVRSRSQRWQPKLSTHWGTSLGSNTRNAYLGRQSADGPRCSAMMAPSTDRPRA